MSTYVRKIYIITISYCMSKLKFKLTEVTSIFKCMQSFTLENYPKCLNFNSFLNQNFCYTLSYNFSDEKDKNCFAKINI